MLNALGLFEPGTWHLIIGLICKWIDGLEGRKERRSAFFQKPRGYDDDLKFA